MQTGAITGQDLKKMIASGHSMLSEKYKVVDSLNVFPVPDGDTGTNMYLTLTAAVQEISKSADLSSVSSVAEAASRGALMGARGNSGVILSQLLRGFAKGVKTVEKANARNLAEALEEGVNVAFKAVMKPMEGTILTVAREAAKEAYRAARKNLPAPEILKQACLAAEETLNRTPEMLSALKEAGVVDAGGMGWLIILKGFYKGLTDENVSKEIIEKPDAAGILTQAVKDEDFEDVFKYPYCTEVLLNLSKSGVAEQIKSEIIDLGNSMMVVESDGLVKVHIHTSHPGNIIEICLNYGTLKDVKINNMIEQAEAKKDTNKQPYGVIAVAGGEGLKRIMEDLDADIVIEGGQSMNPSTQEIMDAVNKINADSVIILPNNSNIIMTANQVADMTDKNVEVIPAKSVVQGINALLSITPNSPIENVLKGMRANIECVKTGEVTFSVRDTKIGGLEIKKGGILGLVDGEIQVVGENVHDTVLELLGKMIDEESEICSLYYGEEVSEDDAQHLIEELKNKYESVDFELHFGGQPLYFYMISVE